MLELGARVDVTGSPVSRRACTARAQPPAGSGVRVEEVHHQTLGLVRALRPAAHQPLLPRGRGKVARKFGALEESCASGESSGGEAPEESVRHSLFGRADPGEVSERSTGAVLRIAPTCAPPAKLRGLARRAKGRRRRRAGHGGKRLPGCRGRPAEVPAPLVFLARW